MGGGGGGVHLTLPGDDDLRHYVLSEKEFHGVEGVFFVRGEEAPERSIYERRKWDYPIPSGLFSLAQRKAINLLLTGCTVVGGE